MIDAINAVRRDPPAYARVLEGVLTQFDGLLWRIPGEIPLQTSEGATPVREAIARLARTKPLPPLAYDGRLARAARDHARDIGGAGVQSHTGTDGSTPRERIARYGSVRGVASEAITFGTDDPQAIVARLIIDDGVPGRSHRETLLDGRFHLAGPARAPHATSGFVCVIDLAQAMR